MQKLKYICAFAVLLYISGCTEKGGDTFDRTAMLTNLGSNIVIPAHQQLTTATAHLKAKKDAFNSNPSLATLDSLKEAFTTAYQLYLAVETYSLSPSDGVRNLNAFPADSNQVKSNITSGVYNLNTASNIRAKGFAAVDYLLYAYSAGEVVALFTTDAKTTNRKQYLTDIVGEIETVTSAAATAWSDYKQQLISASGTDIGSSVSMLVNDISFETERCRRERVGNALGYVGLINSGTLMPELLEAKYSRQSKPLLIANLQALKQLYTGGSGQGFDDYLEYLNSEVGGQPLSSTITTQFDVAIQAAQNVPVDFATALSTNKPEMETLFLELKKLTVLLKVDMSSQLGVVINYSDNDGD